MATTPPTATPEEHDALPAGTRFGELEILRVLGVGGFGIVYLAEDHALERQVALKEYMPSSLAGRGKGGHAVSIRSVAHSETYALGLRSFVNEARLLARFNHPSLVKVYRFWEQNGTAYMVMPYLEGRTLRDVRRSMNVPPDEAWIRSVIDPMLDALELLHGEDVYHRDIAPDNILLPPGEVPVLLDFGAARRAIGDRTQTFTAILKPSYAPIEQYAEAVHLRQGPWTDLYALGAVVYYLLRGVPPPPATARAVQDDTQLLTHEENPGVSARFVDAIEWAMAVRPAERPQSIAELRAVLDGRAEVPPRARAGSTASDRTVVIPQAHQPTHPHPNTNFAPTMPGDQVEAMEATRVNPMAAIAAAAERPTTYPPVGARTAPPVSVPMPAEPKPPRTAPPDRSRPDTTVMPPTATHEPAPARRRGPLMVAAVAAVIGVGAVAAWMAGGRPSPHADTASPAAAIEQPAALANPASAVVAKPTDTTTGTSTATTTSVPALANTSNTSTPTNAAPSTSSADPIEALANGKAKPAAQAAARTAPRVNDITTQRPAEATTARTTEPPAAHKTDAMQTHAGAATASHPAEATTPVHHARRDEPVRPAAEKPAAAETPAAALQAASPREACGSRVFLALAVCMEEQCDRPRFKNHPQCDKVRAMVERRRRAESGG